jgi:DNA polymerase-1
MGQGCARDLMMEGLLRLPTELLPMLRAVVHDEVVLSAPIEDAQEVAAELVAACSFTWCPPHGSRPVAVTAELVGMGTSWADVYEHD